MWSFWVVDQWMELCGVAEINNPTRTKGNDSSLLKTLVELGEGFYRQS